MKDETTTEAPSGPSTYPNTEASDESSPTATIIGVLVGVLLSLVLVLAIVVIVLYLVRRRQASSGYSMRLRKNSDKVKGIGELYNNIYSRQNIK